MDGRPECRSGRSYHHRDAVQLDQLNLFCSDRTLNQAHSNFGFDAGGTPVMDRQADGRTALTQARVNKKNQSFEPPDRAKGQVARMLFYMAVRYEQGDAPGPEYMPDLTLHNQNQRESQPRIGKLCTLLAGHKKFPPTAFEVRRNQRGRELQGNRNPFIDHPAFADQIWGSACR